MVGLSATKPHRSCIGRDVGTKLWRAILLFYCKYFRNSFWDTKFLCDQKGRF